MTTHLTTYSEEDLAFYRNASGSLSVQGRYDHNTTVVAYADYKDLKALIVEKLVYPPEPIYETAKALELDFTIALLNASQIPYNNQFQKNFTMYILLILAFCQVKQLLRT